MKTIKEKTRFIDLIVKFVSNSSGLNLFKDTEDGIRIYQKRDNKSLCIRFSDIQDVIKRNDSLEKIFLQINFKNGRKILLTDQLIGFSPLACKGLNLSHLPKIVTTADLASVIEALETYFHTDDEGTVYEEDLSEVKLFFESISCGAESVGFDLVGERLWIEKILSSQQQVS